MTIMPPWKQCVDHPGRKPFVMEAHYWRHRSAAHGETKPGRKVKRPARSVTPKRPARAPKVKPADRLALREKGLDALHGVPLNDLFAEIKYRIALADSQRDAALSRMAEVKDSARRMEAAWKDMQRPPTVLERMQGTRRPLVLATIETTDEADGRPKE